MSGARARPVSPGVGLQGRPSQRPAARLAERDPRLHYAARAEDVLDRALVALLRRRGWTPSVTGYTGYGGPGWVRVLGRVVVSRPARPGRATADAGRGWRSFFSAPVDGAAVEVTVGQAVHLLVTGRGGYLDARLPSDLPEGTHRVRMRVARPPQARATPEVAPEVVVVGEGDCDGVICDIDDTVVITSLPRPLIAAYNTLIVRQRARRPVPGMADLLREATATPGTPLVYVSTGAWNTAPVLARFLTRWGFPPGPMLLTDWGPTNTGWFRSGPEHKHHALRRLASELPQVRWLLVGDDGQHDPALYSAFRDEVPGAVRGIAIRQLTATEQVLSHVLPVAVNLHTAGRGGAATEVRGPDGDSLAHQLRRAGLL